MGLRVVRRLRDRFRILATTHSPERSGALRLAGAMPVVADLDRPHTLTTIGGLAPTVLHLAPPPSNGTLDLRTRALCNALHGTRRLVYISTSGVYGECDGAWIDETRPLRPLSGRAARRVDAERTLRAWARTRGVALTILRVPGIYAADRLPLARLSGATPVLRAAEDVYTNHIHADDLARLVVLALHRGAPQRAYHAVDDSAIKMGDWFDAIADAWRQPRPERVSRDEIEGRTSPERMSFMRESRRLRNRRMHDELGMRLDYPTVHDGLAAAVAASPA